MKLDINEGDILCVYVIKPNSSKTMTMEYIAETINRYKRLCDFELTVMVNVLPKDFCGIIPPPYTLTYHKKSI